MIAWWTILGPIAGAAVGLALALWLNRRAAAILRREEEAYRELESRVRERLGRR